MPFVIVYKCNGCTYWVQDYNGEFILNGLINNAAVFPYWHKAEETKRYIEGKSGAFLTIQSITNKP